MVRNHNHAPNVEAIANRIRLVLLVIMIAVFAYIAVSSANGNQAEAIQYEEHSGLCLNKGEYEATLTVSTSSGRITVPVKFVVENDGEFGKVNLLNK